jgi:hypothetical protein
MPYDIDADDLLPTLPRHQNDDVRNCGTSRCRSSRRALRSRRHPRWSSSGWCSACSDRRSLFVPSLVASSISNVAQPSLTEATDITILPVIGAESRTHHKALHNPTFVQAYAQSCFPPCRHPGERRERSGSASARVGVTLRDLQKCEPVSDNASL